MNMASLLLMRIGLIKKFSYFLQFSIQRQQLKFFSEESAKE
ncbi:hypothetical protein DB41_IB00750 [Neochlamydia sp. TUME1]|nr:hypothetical protein DB41_IB00750 [Neochlamydia sp. TUME1]